MHRDTASGESKNGDVLRISSERGDVLQCPLEGCDLVHIGVVALGLIRMFLTESREGEEPETPDAVIEGNQYDALLGELHSRIAR